MAAHDGACPQGPLRALLDTDMLSEPVRQPQGMVAARIAAVGKDAVCTSVHHVQHPRGRSYPAQQESLATSVLNPNAASFKPSTVVR